MRDAIMVLLGLLAACDVGESLDAARESSTSVVIAPDTMIAFALRDSAKITLATLAERATFDSVVVIQPPRDADRLPAMAVCGRIGGLPGRSSPARFVYQSKWTVFVEEDANQAAFGELWARSCAVSGGTVVVKE